MGVFVDCLEMILTFEYTLVKQIDHLRVGMPLSVSVTQKEEERPSCMLEEISSNYFELGHQFYPPCGLK